MFSKVFVSNTITIIIFGLFKSGLITPEIYIELLFPRRRIARSSIETSALIRRLVLLSHTTQVESLITKWIRRRFIYLYVG